MCLQVEQESGVQYVTLTLNASQYDNREDKSGISVLTRKLLAWVYTAALFYYTTQAPSQSAFTVAFISTLVLS